MTTPDCSQNFLPLASQIAIVTGAGRGIGAAVSHRLAALGATVVLTSRTAGQLEELAEAIRAAGGKAEAHALDLRSEESITALMQALKERHGRVDILVNNAGIGSLGHPLHEMDPGAWNDLMATNLRGPYLMIRAFAPMMIAARRGHILNIASLAGHNPLKNGAAYAASKWGLNGLTYSVAEELRDYGVRVSAIAPGSVNTSFGHTEDGSWKIQPEDIAAAVELIVTQADSSFISEIKVRPLQKKKS
ncbi:SDR family oxidoreductase [Silvibacterium dinghuense]|uniref:SDR family oxidoreductase n=1 Tax=Silvibacterium dinghuense TaxID=1560006 RepID=A0A4Q1SD84_9BACT|nr:SDR family oxidoreductase [Silvibacterium dinghuense]RXS95037.1 SDR family oxidoreductase [Silvibacterium dinghuense]GGH10036.1 short-chain dehydrogenase [Silvibacterium dinghuense]